LPRENVADDFRLFFLSSSPFFPFSFFFFFISSEKMRSDREGAAGAP